MIESTLLSRFSKQRWSKCIFFADRLQAGPLARTYMLGYEQIMRKKSIKSRKYRVHSPSKRQNILIFHQNPLQHPISSLSANHVIIYCAKATFKITLSISFLFDAILDISSERSLSFSNAIYTQSSAWSSARLIELASDCSLIVAIS